MPVPDELGHTQRAARVAGGRLDPESLERTLAENPTVPDAVECHPPSETEVLEPGFAVRAARHSQHDLLAYFLDRAGEVHLLLRELGLRYSGWPAEQCLEGGARHRKAAEVVEIFLVQRERTVFAKIHELAVNEVHVLGFPIGRQPHHF